ncbi:hypothetical protein [Halobacteriovorax marinus]|uniref:hypothetical protein n=1 Tax=Halobacteriovorax marinus TaxID=97084 RepID=UPI003A9273EE
MKSLCVCTLFLLLSISTFGFEREVRAPEGGGGSTATPVVSIPKFEVNTLQSMSKAESTSREVEQVSKSNIKKLAFDPLLRVIGNRGGFTTSFKMELPPFFLSLKKIQFTYFTEYRDSSFLGNGWRWDIPKISNRETVNFLPYSVEGILGDGDLKEVDFSKDDIRGHIESILKNEGQEIDDLDFNIFQINYSSNENYFIRLNNHGLGWIVLVPNGERWIFNKNGDPIKVFDKYGHSISIKWSDIYLSKMTYSNNTQVHFEYTKGNLTQIKMLGANKERSFEIQYDENRLKYASYVNAVTPTFQGEYRDLYQEIEVSDKTLGVNDYKSNKGVKASEGVNKYIKFDFEKYENSINSIINGQRYYNNWHGEYYEHFVINEDRPPYISNKLNSVPFSVSNHTIPAEFKPYSINVTTSDTWNKEEKLHIIQNHFNVINKRALFLVDMNNDGEKDLVSCPVKELPGSFASNILKVLKGKSIKEGLGEGLVGYSSWKEQGFKLLSKKVGEFNCNENTFFLDWDRDGRVDVLNLSELYINRKNGFEKMNIGLSDLKKRFTSFSTTDSKKEDLVIRDLNKDGVFEIYNSEEMKGKTVKLRQNLGLLTTLYSPFGGKINIKYQVYQKRALLPVEFSYVGDEKVETEKIYYLFPNEDSGFREIIHVRSNEKQTLSVNRKTYCNVTNNGEIESRKTRNTLCISTNYDSITSYNYFKKRESGYEDEKDDFNDLIVSLGRHEGSVRLNRRPDINTPLINPGRYLELPTIDRGRSFGLRKGKGRDEIGLSNYDPSKIELKSEGLIWPIGNRPVPHGVLYDKSYKSIDGRNVLVRSNKREFYEEYISGKKNIFSKKTASLSYRKGVIVKTTTSEKGYSKDLVFNVNYEQFEKGISEIVRNSFYKKGISKRLSLKKYEYETDLLRPIKISTFLNNEVLIPVSVERIDYDKEGRVVRRGEFDNTLSEYSYKEQSPFLTFKIENGRKSYYSYEQVTGFLQKTEIDGETKNYNYSSDGFLFQVNLNDTNIYTFRSPKVIDSNFPIKISRTFNEMKNDVSFSYELDSMGRVKKSQKDGSEVVERFEYSFFGNLLSNDNGRVLTRYSEKSYCSSEEKFSSLSGEFLSSIRKCQKGMDQLSKIDGVLGHVKFEDNDVLESKYGSMIINPVFNERRELTRFKQLPLQWERNIEGDRIEQIFKFSKASKPHLRKYYNREKKLVDEYGSSFKFNKYDQILETNSNRGDNYILNETYHYSHGELSIAMLGETSFTYSYQNGIVDNMSFLNDEIEFKYDEYSRPIEKRWGTHREVLAYENGLVSRIDPFVVKVERGVLDEVETIHFLSGVSLRYKVDKLSRDLGIELKSKDRIIYESNITYTPFSKISQIELEYFSRRIEKDYQYKKDMTSEVIHNNPFSPGSEQIIIKKDIVQDHVLTIDHPDKLIRNKKLQAENVGKYKIEYINDMPVKISHEDKVIHQFFTASGEMRGSCLGLNKLDPKSKLCWMKIDRDHFKIMGDNFSLVRLEGRPIGVAVNGVFFPGIFSHRGSLLGLLDSESGELIFVREFSDYGIKKVEFNSNLDRIELEKARRLERRIPWSFAKLFENPFLSGEGLYFSNSRTLSSHHGEWLTFDPMLKWSPENLINSPVDMNGLKYVNGDPVNFVDPSGYRGIGVGGGFNFTIGLLRFDGNIDLRIVQDSTKSFLDLSSYSMGLHYTAPSLTSFGDKKNGDYRSGAAGIHFDVGFNVKSNNADNISQLGGKTLSSGVTLGKGVDLGFDLTTSIRNSNGESLRNFSNIKISELTFSIGGGLGVEGHVSTESENIELFNINSNQ